YVVDSAGNLASAATRFVTTDTSVPTVSVVSPVNDSNYNSSSVLINVSSSEEGTGMIVPNLDNSLVSWWRMDDANATSVDDYIGGNNGTIVNALQTDGGKFGKGFLFDGSGDYVNMGDVDVAEGVSSMTWSFWTKPNDVANNFDCFVCKWHTSTDEGSFFIRQDGTGKIDFSVMNDSSMDTASSVGYSMSDGVWTYVAVTFNSGSVRFYENGINIVNDTFTVTSINDSDLNLFIGAASNSAQYFNGIIDEVIIFNRSLSADEILGLYNASVVSHSETSLAEGSHTFDAYTSDLAGNVVSDLNAFAVDSVFPTVVYDSTTSPNASSKNTGDVFVNLTTVDAGDSYAFADFDNDLVGWWRMDVLNSTGGVVDESAYGNNGSAVGNAVQTDGGRFGKGFAFDGDGDYVSASGLTSLSNDSWSVSVWFNTASTDEQEIVYAYSTGTGDERIRIYTVSNNFAHIDDFSGFKQTVGGVSINNWHHGVVTYDFPNQNLSIFLDGAYDSSDTSFTQASSAVGKFEIGTRSSGLQYDFNGSIDEVVVFNRVLSAVEISALYNASANQYYNNFTGLSDAEHNFTGYVVDSAGNLASAATRFVTTDTSAPTVSVVSPVNDSSYNSSSVLINVSSSEEGTGMIVPNLDSSLVSWWRMDDLNSSGGVVDYLGVNNGTPVNEAAQTDGGKFGKGFEFDGSGDYVQMADTESLNL
ncbi:MAG: LamG domain-containing protein, partial [Anaerolineales bacterium]|nr:LamG domain-containing protein [Anaerolineales bacterium]